MNWLVWLGLAVVIAAVAAVTGINHHRPEGPSFDAALNATGKKSLPDQEN